MRIFRLGLDPACALALDSRAFAGEQCLAPLSFTFYQAALSTLLTLLAGLPGGLPVRPLHLPGARRCCAPLTTVPFILPTVVVAAGFNALLGPRGWVNVGLMDLFHLSTAPHLLL